MHPTGIALHARVSSSDQKSDLDRLSRLVQLASEKQLHAVGAVAGIGSGLNGKRHRLLKAVADRSGGAILVEHRDRLARFGSEDIAAALQASGRRIMVVGQAEMQDDLMQDMSDVLYEFPYPAIWTKSGQPPGEARLGGSGPSLWSLGKTQPVGQRAWKPEPNA